MGKIIYYFLDFTLDPAARELRKGATTIDLPSTAFDCLTYLVQNRGRAVGRDELISAVWGRLEINENLLSQALVRIRRSIGDDGKEQQTIRTVMKFGYRWVAQTTEVQRSDSNPIAEAKAEIPDVPFDNRSPQPLDASIESAAPGEKNLTSDANPQRSAVEADHAKTTTLVVRPFLVAGRPRMAAYAIASFLIVLVAFGLFRLSTERVVTESPTAKKADIAIVLPATVEASADWGWLRLGVMDLVRTQLSHSGLVTMNSESTLVLLNKSGAPTATNELDLPSLVARRIYPTVTFETGIWRMQLTSISDAGTVRVESSGSDPIATSRSVADALLAKLGYKAVTVSSGGNSDFEKLKDQVEAAILANHLDLAADLMEKVSPAMKEMPEFQLLQSQLDQRAGHYDVSLSRLEKLLAEGVKLDARVKALTLGSLGYAYGQLYRSEDAVKMLTQAISMSEGDDSQSSDRGIFLLNRAYAYQVLGKYDEAYSDLAKSRVDLEEAGDILNVAKVDHRLAGLQFTRMRLDESMSAVQKGAEEFAFLGDKPNLARCWQLAALIDIQRLDYKAAFAYTERYWPPETYVDNDRDKWFLIVVRAIALVAQGNLSEAEVLIQRVREGALPDRDAAPRRYVDILDARIAFYRKDYESAIKLAKPLTLPDKILQENRQEAWHVLIKSLRAAGHSEETANETHLFSAWAETSSDDDLRSDALLMEAEQSLDDKQDEQALRQFATSLDIARKVQVPARIVAVSVPYILALLKLNKLEDAKVVSGSIGLWAKQDLNAAWAQAQVYNALGETAAYSRTLDIAKHIAGEKSIPPPVF